MFRRPFLVFLIIVGTLIAGVLWFIQSAQFAGIVKSTASKHLPRDAGIEGDFSDFSIKLFPPGFSVRNPQVVLKRKNVFDLPPGSSVKAERIDFEFRPFQILSGEIRVNKVTLVNGDVKLRLNLEPKSVKEAEKEAEKKKKSSRLELHWDELFQVRAESIALENVQLSLERLDAPMSIRARTRSLKLSQWMGKGGLGYSFGLDLDTIEGDFPKDLAIPSKLERVSGEVFLNARGVILKSFFMAQKEVEVLATGELNGNILNPSGLKADAQLMLKGDIGRLTQIFTPRLYQKMLLPSGNILFKGKVEGNLEKSFESLLVDGNVTIKNFSYQSWKADLIQAEAQWKPSPSGGEISLIKGVIGAHPSERKGGFQPGSGGQIELGPIRWNLGSSEPLSVPIHLEKAHIHWLAAGVLKDVYPINLRASGKIQADVKLPGPKTPWGVDAKVNLGIDDFQLDNQRYQKTKPLRKLFDIPRLDLSGPIKVGPSGLELDHIQLKIKNTELDAVGKIDGKTGYQLKVAGPVQLQDIREVSETPISGKGTLGASIHGPSSDVIVDIDLDLKEASYLNLSLGDFQGRVTWDDGMNQLLFTEVNLKHAETSCRVNGLIDLQNKGEVRLDALSKGGNIRHLSEIFGNITKNLSWFPRELNGSVNADMKVRGGLALDELQIDARFDGENWDYWGEHFKKVKFIGGYDRGSYYMRNLRLTKRTGMLSGYLYFDSDQNLDWELETHGAVLNDWDYIAQMDVPIRGNLSIRSEGHGKLGSVDSLTRFRLNQFSMRGQNLASSEAYFETENGVWKLQSNLLEGQGKIDVLYGFKQNYNNSIKAALNQIDFTPILLLLNPAAMKDRDLEGRVSASIALSFLSDDFLHANGKVILSEYLLSNSRSKFYLEKPIETSIVKGDFELGSLRLRSPSGMAIFRLKNSGGKLAGSLLGEVDISLVEFFTPAIAYSSGALDLNLSVGGKLDAPTFLGVSKVRDGSIRLDSLDSPIENIAGQFQIKQNVIYVQNVKSDLGGGQLGVDGQIQLYSNRYPEIFLKGAVRGTKIKVYPFQFVKVNGTLELVGGAPPYTINGNILVDSALSREKVLGQSRGSGLKTSQYAPSQSGALEGGASKFKLNIGVDAPGRIIVQNDLFKDLHVKGKMTLVNTLSAPRVLGDVEVEKGKVVFKDHAFVIQSAAAHFDNPKVINPSFDLSASSSVNGFDIHMYASGRVDKLKVEFTSNPALQESEILSLLTMGLTSSEAKKLSASDLSVVQQGEAASLILHSLDFNRDLEDKTGFQIQLDESVNTQQGVSAFRPQSQTDAAAAPQIVIRRKVGERLSMSAGSTVGVGTNKSLQMNLDYSVSPEMSITGTFNNYGTGAETQVIQNSLGVDFRFQKRFK